MLLCAGAVALSAAGAAAAGGGRYTIDGGTPQEREQVRLALDASAFDWSIVPQVAIHIGRGLPSTASTGSFSLDADLLDAGRFSWGVVQHEYAHELDLLVLTDADRARLAQALGGTAWWPTAGSDHGALTCERFAAALAWAYWPSSDNVMAPESQDDEAASMAPSAFRALLAAVVASHQLIAAFTPKSA